MNRVGVVSAPRPMAPQRWGDRARTNGAPLQASAAAMLIRATVTRPPVRDQPLQFAARHLAIEPVKDLSTAMVNSEATGVLPRWIKLRFNARTPAQTSHHRRISLPPKPQPTQPSRGPGVVPPRFNQAPASLRPTTHSTNHGHNAHHNPSAGVLLVKRC